MLKDIKNLDANRMSQEELLATRSAILKEIENRRDTQRDTESTTRGGEEVMSSEQLVEKLRIIEKVIYGVDDRKEAYEITNSRIKENINSVVALIRKNDISDNGDGKSTIRTRIFGVARNLCENEKFYNQPIAPFCSGFLVSKDLIATAAHCVENQEDLKSIRFVFGFRMKNQNEGSTVIDNSDIYEGESIVNRILDDNGSDWAVIKLKNQVVNDHKPVVLRRTGKISDNESVYVVGHPVGLPTKFADGANVRNNTNESFFVCNLDTYGGNSGSPVFNSSTHELEGILVRGETDFITTENGCRKSNVCPQNDPDKVCRGEDCTRSTAFVDFVPST
jgi:hypothetical protein